MKVEMQWKEGMAFEAKTGPHSMTMDARPPIGRYSAATPKELVAAGLCGCTGMDVIALMRKHRQEVRQFTVKADITAQEIGHPAVFTAAKIDFYLEGNVDPKIAVEAVHLSQSQYCGVSAMLAKAFPISWEVFVNGNSVGKGQADFKTS